MNQTMARTMRARIILAEVVVIRSLTREEDDALGEETDGIAPIVIVVWTYLETAMAVTIVIPMVTLIANLTAIQTLLMRATAIVINLTP